MSFRRFSRFMRATNRPGRFAGTVWTAVGILLTAAGCSDEGTRLGGYAPTSANVSAADLAPAALADYLARSALATPELVRSVGDALRGGRDFRQRVRDQQNRPTLATVYVDPGNTLHVVTFRTETCPECRGTGTRPAPFSAINQLSVELRCLKCDGKKKLENFADERKYLLTVRDFRDPEAARQRLASQVFADAPPEAAKWINALASHDPRERLAACVWLDRNYVKVGARFQTLMPMLEKNRKFERHDDKKMMGWQFWAGRDMPGEEKRAYYHVIADARTGKVTSKGFYADR